MLETASPLRRGKTECHLLSVGVTAEHPRTERGNLAPGIATGMDCGFKRYCGTPSFIPVMPNREGEPTALPLPSSE